MLKEIFSWPKGNRNLTQHTGCPEIDSPLARVTHCPRSYRALRQSCHVRLLREVLKGTAASATRHRTENMPLYNSAVVNIRPDMPRGIFQQDEVITHTAAKTKRWCHDNFSDFWTKGIWSGNIPDLSPIENLWAIIRNKVDKMDLQYQKPLSSQTLGRPGAASRQKCRTTRCVGCRSVWGPVWRSVANSATMKAWTSHSLFSCYCTRLKGPSISGHPVHTYTVATFHFIYKITVHHIRLPSLDSSPQPRQRPHVPTRSGSGPEWRAVGLVAVIGHCPARSICSKVVRSGIDLEGGGGHAVTSRRRRRRRRGVQSGMIGGIWNDRGIDRDDGVVCATWEKRECVSFLNTNKMMMFGFRIGVKDMLTKRY